MGVNEMYYTKKEAIELSNIPKKEFEKIVTTCLRNGYVFQKDQNQNAYVYSEEDVNWLKEIYKHAKKGARVVEIIEALEKGETKINYYLTRKEVLEELNIKEKELKEIIDKMIEENYPFATNGNNRVYRRQDIESMRKTWQSIQEAFYVPSEGSNFDIINVNETEKEMKAAIKIIAFLAESDDNLAKEAIKLCKDDDTFINELKEIPLYDLSKKFKGAVGNAKLITCLNKVKERIKTSAYKELKEMVEEIYIFTYGELKRERLNEPEYYKYIDQFSFDVFVQWAITQDENYGELFIHHTNKKHV